MPNRDLIKTFYEKLPEFYKDNVELEAKYADIQDVESFLSSTRIMLSWKPNMLIYKMLKE